MIKGITVSLISRTVTGTDSSGLPVYTETQSTVGNVLVGRPSAGEVADSAALYGRKADYKLAIPKGDTNNWENAVVVLPEPFPGTYRVVGLPIAGIDANVPLAWNKRVFLARETANAPCRVTLMNTVVTTDESTFQDIVEQYQTILQNVLLEGVDATGEGKRGLEGADSVRLLIPFDVEAVDAETGAAKTYVPPKEFAAASDKSALWTLSDDRTTAFVRGTDAAQGKKYLVRSVRENLPYTGALWRFEAGGV